jgi:hypothetical protein
MGPEDDPEVIIARLELIYTNIFVGLNYRRVQDLPLGV